MKTLHDVQRVHGNIPSQWRHVNQRLERCLTSRKGKEIHRGIGNTRLPRRHAIQPRPAVAHPDGASGHALGHMRARLKHTALVQEAYLLTIFDPPGCSIGRGDPHRGFGIEFRQRGERPPMIVKAMEVR